MQSWQFNFFVMSTLYLLATTWLVEIAYFLAIHVLRRFLVVILRKKMFLILRIQRDSYEDIIEFLEKSTNAIDCMIVILLCSRQRHVSAKFMWFSCGLIPTHYNCGCLLALATLKIATWMAETCRLLLYNKLTLIHWNVLVGVLKM
jgi:hypothetical protein